MLISGNRNALVRDSAYQLPLIPTLAFVDNRVASPCQGHAQRPKPRPWKGESSGLSTHMAGIASHSCACHDSIPSFSIPTLRKLVPHHGRRSDVLFELYIKSDRHSLRAHDLPNYRHEPPLPLAITNRNCSSIWNVRSANAGAWWRLEFHIA